LWYIWFYDVVDKQRFKQSEFIIVLGQSS
jgi:hypothetical protein